MIKMTDFSDLENEFKSLFHHQKVCFRTQKKIDNGINQRCKDNENGICYVGCKYGLSQDKDEPKPLLHYGFEYWGSDEYNMILEKYNLRMEWENS